jgi:mRNA interferase MazF
MTTYQPGDLLLIAFPYTGGSGSKIRPALVIADTGDADVVIARISSRAPMTPYDVPLTAWAAAGLNGPTSVRTHKLATMEKALVQRFLGHIDAADRPRVATMIRSLLGSW